ncbi:anthranilate phosphoribosyltransferase, partial [Candidatus Fermentibacterales bacterium]|nr:anthranilate phosphoribosyltransferase [Candidatus Fermentibacterales bacterium]
MIREAIAEAVEGRELPGAVVEAAFREMTEGSATDAQIAGFLMAMRCKRETVSELVAAARVMRERCSKVPVRRGRRCSRLVDTCGTGGDMTRSFNFSTLAALVVAGAGVPVAKHGNRAVSSGCGSADLMEALGVRLTMTPEEIGGCIEDIGIGFLYAPALHGSMRHVSGPRRELGQRTMFNLLGPLCNPAGADAQLLGVCSGDLTETLAEALSGLGCRGALVVHGEGGYDEMTVTGRTRVSKLDRGSVRSFWMTPGDFGLGRSHPQDLLGG